MNYFTFNFMVYELNALEIIPNLCNFATDVLEKEHGHVSDLLLDMSYQNDGRIQ